MKLIVLKNNVPIDEVTVETASAQEMYEIFIGRSEDCHVIVDDPLISRHHFVLKSQGASWVCEKLSKLGVISVNGQVADKLSVKNGDEIKFGIYSILVTDLPVEEKKQQASTPSIGPENIYETSVKMEDELHTPELSPVEELTTTVMMDPPATQEQAIDEFNSITSEPLEDPMSETSGEQAVESSEVGLGEFQSTEEESVDTNNDFGADSQELVSASDFADEGSSESEEDSKTRVDQFFVNYILRLFGEHAPYDRFNLTEAETFIGRDSKKCQIVLDDPEVSSVHAVIRKTLGQVILEDLNSSNGTILNGERINKSPMVPGDEFVIGGTSFSFEVKSDLLASEQDRLLPVESGQVIEREEIEEEEVALDEGELGFDSNQPEDKSLVNKFRRMIKNEPKRAAIYGVVGLGLLIFLFAGDEETPVVDQKKPVVKKEQTNQKPKIKLSAELESRRNVAYELGVSFFEQEKYYEALKEFQTVAEIDPQYKKNQTYLEQTKVGLKRLEELETKRREEEERIKIKKMIEEILVKARAAVKERQVSLAESYFSQIIEKDPENIEVQQLKLELEDWQKEEQKKALEKAAKEAARKAMVDALAPGKASYLKKEWYVSILKLEEFLRRKATDEDLIKEASEMLGDAKNQLASELGPLLGKARSLKEGQDLKNAYEAFLEILKLEPTNSEALNEVDDIRSQLDARSKRVYREAIIAESLSLFGDAKEKFQEVQQVSPTDSEYYKKATEKLKNYLE